MKVIVKKLQGDECSVEIQPTTLISELKEHISQKLGIPVGQQKLLLLGRTLADEQIVSSYPNIKEGTKLNVIVKKPETLYDSALEYFKKAGSQDKEAISKSNRLLKILEEKFNKMSWDDIEKLAHDCLVSEDVNLGKVNRIARE